MLSKSTEVLDVKDSPVFEMEVNTQQNVLKTHVLTATTILI